MTVTSTVAGYTVTTGRMLEMVERNRNDKLWEKLEVVEYAVVTKPPEVIVVVSSFAMAGSPRTGMASRRASSA